MNRVLGRRSDLDEPELKKRLGAALRTRLGYHVAENKEFLGNSVWANTLQAQTIYAPKYRFSFRLPVRVSQGLAGLDVVPDALLLCRRKHDIMAVITLLTSTLSSGKPPLTLRSHIKMGGSSLLSNQTRNLPAVSSEFKGMTETALRAGDGKVRSNSVDTHVARCSLSNFQIVALSSQNAVIPATLRRHFALVEMRAFKQTTHTLSQNSITMRGCGRGLGGTKADGSSVSLLGSCVIDVGQDAAGVSAIVQCRRSHRRRLQTSPTT